MGSSSGDTNQTTTTHFEPPDWTSGANGSPFDWNDYVQRGGELAQKYGNDPSLIYGNSPNQPMVAQMSDLQNKGANAFYGMASQGNPNDQLSASYIANLLNGGQQNVQPNNPYMGNSPQFEDMLAASNKDITDNFARGTAAQTDASAAKSGAFGGSAYNEMTQQNAKTLGNLVAQNSNSQRNAQFDKSANLAENQINRGWQGYENAANRGLQGIGLQNQMNATDLQRWQAVMGAGDTQQQTQQNNINAAENLFNQNVQWPIYAEQLYGDILQRASGQGGSNSQTVQLPGYSGLLNGIGAAGGLASLFGGGK